MIKPSIRSIQVLLLLTMCFLTSGLFLLTRSGTGPEKQQSSIPEPKYEVPRRIQYSFTLQNTSRELLRKAELWAYAPVKETSTQRCIGISASHPYELIPDDSGNQILHFTLLNIPPFASKILTIKADLMLSTSSNPIALEEKEMYLNPGKYIESDHPEIIKISRQLYIQNPLESAQRAHAWVSEAIQYTGYLKNEHGALYALKHKKGDCTEFMYLFTAICRANKIPARCIGGYVISENSALRPNDYHNWSEFLVDGLWRTSDPQKMNFNKNQDHYIAFKIFDGRPGDPMNGYHRFRYLGDGLKVRMNG